MTERAQVGASVKYRYQHVFDRWLEEQEPSDGMLLNATRTDAALVRFFDNSFLEGQGPSTGTKLFCSLQYHRPEYSRWGTLRIPMASQALKGWSTLFLSNTRRLWPWAVVEALATIMVCLGFSVMARYWVLMLDILRRPSEVLRLRCRQMGCKTAAVQTGCSARPPRLIRDPEQDGRDTRQRVDRPARDGLP